MDFEDIMLSQKASHKMKYTVPFNLDVVPGVVRFTETGHRMVIARGRRSYCLTGIEFQFGEMKKFWRPRGADGCPKI